MRKVVFLTLLAALPGSLAAQAADPDKAVSGSGIAVKGWMGRVDNPARQKIEDVKFVDMGGGYHVTGGPHAILWNPANTASGNYTVRARFTKTPASRSTHEESYGLFIAGTQLDKDSQNYLYCVVFGTGNVMVRHRFGGETHTLLGKTADAAISKMGERGATDEIAMWVSADRVGCTVNGKEVFSGPKSEMIGPGKLVSTDGVYGLRASHNLDIHVAGLSVTK
jgi:hypothetical protein